MGNTALLIIDVQHGVFLRKHYDGKAVYQEDSFLEKLKTLSDNARAAGVPVIYFLHLYENFPPMAKGSPYWLTHPAIAPRDGDIVIEKSHADAFWDTPLLETLQSLHVDTLVFTGMQTEFCMDTTLRRALSLGFTNFLVSDGHSTLDSDILPAEKIIAHHNAVWATQFAEVLPADNISFAPDAKS
jgi:nicotinamidase-related amidase